MACPLAGRFKNPGLNVKTGEKYDMEFMLRIAPIYGEKVVL